jgi:hypothetical protein
MASKFIKGFKGPVALMAFIVSLIALGHTIYNQMDQNRRWDALNRGRIDITDIGFTAFKLMTVNEVKETDWGFNLTYTYDVEDGVVSDKIKILSTLVLWDTAKDERIRGDMYLTISEAKLAMERLKLNPDTTDIYFYRNAYFNVKNTGVSSLSNVSFKIWSNLKNEVRLAKENEKIAKTQGVEYLPGKTGLISFGFYVPLDKKLPETMEFNVKASYTDLQGQPVSQTFSYDVNGLNNSWAFVAPREIPPDAVQGSC